MATQKQVFTEITESIDRCNHTLPGLIQFLKNGFKKLENATGSGGGGSEVSWTQIQATGTKIAEIEIDGDKTSVYAPTGATPTISVNAEDVAYSNTVSGLTATNVQGAIDEVKSLIPGASGSVSVTADGVKTYSALFDELYALIDSTKINSKSALAIDDAIAYISYLSAASYGFTRSFCSTDLQINSYAITSSGSSYKTGIPGTVSDLSTSVPANGTVIKINY